MKLVINKRIIYVFIMLILPLFFVEKDVEAATVKTGKPEALKISIIDNNNIKISWKAVKGVDKYEVFCAEGKNRKYRKIKTVSKCSYKKCGHMAGKKYYYKVRAYKIQSGKKTYGPYSTVKSVIFSQQTGQSTFPAPPVFTSIEDINNIPSDLPYFMFFTVMEISEKNIYLSSETNPYSQCYILENPYNSNINEGTRLKIVNPQINPVAESDGKMKIAGYTRIDILGEGYWTNTPLYVKQISEGILYLSDGLSETITFTIDLRYNEILVMKNGQYGTVEDIKVDDKLVFYISSPMAACIPGKILDCTKICILS